MKKLVTIILMYICTIGFTKANPIACPPVISEFFLVDNSHWYLELVFLKSGCWKKTTTLDGYTLTTSAGTVNFKTGIAITPDSILVITHDNMQALTQINRAGDFITIKDATGIIVDQLNFGNTSNPSISAPKIGQSIVNYSYGCWNQQTSKSDILYVKVKDNHPTIGSNGFKPYDANAATTRGTFTGIVYDKAHQPVPGIHVGNQYYYIPVNVCETYFKSTVTASDGTFSIPEYSGRYNVNVFFQPSHLFYHSIINIEPDSMNYYEFTIDTTLTGISKNEIEKSAELMCFPNPSNSETTISFVMPASMQNNNALIKIYNSVGEMVCILPVNNTISQKKYVVKWNGAYNNTPVPSGIYYCKLEFGGLNIAVEKIVIER